ncbi:MAG: phenylalanine--tRNA ligase subunit alpha [Spirochaetales bacterium]|nr:phenylalanine--tRNA ligase subunit alpha [Spirochaetales bacterium]
MNNNTILEGLHPLEIKLLLGLPQEESLTAAAIEAKLGYNTSQANQVLSWLAQKGLVREAARRTIVSYALTDLGKDYLEKGTPEELILNSLKNGPIYVSELAQKTGLEQKDAGSSFGQMSKKGFLYVTEDKHISTKAADEEIRAIFVTPKKVLLQRLSSSESIPEDELDNDARALASELGAKRGSARSPIKILEREAVTFAFAPEAAEIRSALQARGVTGDEIGALTPEILSSGEWKNRGFRSFNVGAPPARVIPGRKNAYVEFLDKLKDKLVSLGFEEFDGPMVESDFWNCDALFMPQSHPARDIHDVYYVKNPTHARKIAEPFLSRVAAAHENGWETGSLGWRYPFDRDFTRRLVLRSQGTGISAQTLTRARIPGKYFGVVRCFRYDKIDATHLADFYQTEGIILGEGVNLRTLLGLLKMFATEVAGATEVKFVPAYFPYTEPSVEVHIKHPQLGWFELGGSGIFRPEVTEPLGVTVPVLAWGLGIDRMALMALGLNDLRHLFSNDLEEVRLMRRS